MVSIADTVGNTAGNSLSTYGCRHVGDTLSSSPAGITVSVADKVDSLVGLVGAGCATSATADPFGLRRTANGLLQMSPTQFANRCEKNRGA